MNDIMRPATAECKCGGDLEREGDTWYHSRIEDFSHTPEPKVPQTYHGIVKAVCLNCGTVTTDTTTLEIMNDAPGGVDCRSCGVHDILWTLADGRRTITQDLDDEGTVFFKIVPELAS